MLPWQIIDFEVVVGAFLLLYGFLFIITAIVQKINFGRRWKRKFVPAIIFISLGVGLLIYVSQQEPTRPEVQAQFDQTMNKGFNLNDFLHSLMR